MTDPTQSTGETMEVPAPALGEDAPHADAPIVVRVELVDVDGTLGVRILEPIV